MVKNRALIIGAGLGGLSAAISLASRGWAVTVAEKNPIVGGKLNIHKENQFTFDLGPSLLTMPQIFRALFQRAGKNMEEYLQLQPINPQWRNIFEDGVKFDLSENVRDTASALNTLFKNGGEQFLRFLSYADKQRTLVESLYFKEGIDSVAGLLLHSNPLKILRLDLYKSASGSISKYIVDEHLKDTLNYFCKYVGSSPDRAPGYMNLLSSIQFAYGVHYVKGGMYKLASALKRLLSDFGGEIRTGYEATGIETGSQNTIKAVCFKNGEKISCDMVVSNMELIPFYQRVAGLTDKARSLSGWFPPSCSGLVIHLGVNRIYPNLAHHNIFHSASPHEQFQSVFKRFVLPDDPTLYVVAPCRTDPDLAPVGHSIIKILPQIPSLYRVAAFSRSDLEPFRQSILQKLERMGLTNLREHIVCEKTLTPYDLRELYYSYRGSIYGTVCDRWRNMGFKAPQKSKIFDNLYFVGGSVNPGGGMPMVVLGGMQVAKRIGFPQ